MNDDNDSVEFKEFAENTLETLVPKLKESAHVVAIAPTGGTADIEMAVEIGLAILMDKPLIVIAPKGRACAERLLRIADHVITGDMTSGDGMADISRQLERLLKQ